MRIIISKRSNCLIGLVPNFCFTIILGNFASFSPFPDLHDYLIGQDKGRHSYAHDNQDEFQNCRSVGLSLDIHGCVHFHFPVVVGNEQCDKLSDVNEIAPVVLQGVFEW